MFNNGRIDVEIAPPSVVLQAAHDFAAALTATPQFTAFETAMERLNNDQAAQAAIRAFENKQQSLQMMLQLNAASSEDRAELERLRQAFLAQASVNAYFQAQLDLTTVCQAAAAIITESTGLSYSATCSSGCCG